MEKLTGKKYEEFEKLHHEESAELFRNKFSEVCEHDLPQNILEICTKTYENKPLSVQECETLNEYLLGILEKTDEKSSQYITGPEGNHKLKTDDFINTVWDIENLFSHAKDFFTKYDCNYGPWERKIVKDSNSRQNLDQLNNLEDYYLKSFITKLWKCHQIALEELNLNSGE